MLLPTESTAEDSSKTTPDTSDQFYSIDGLNILLTSLLESSPQNPLSYLHGLEENNNCNYPHYRKVGLA